MTNQMEKTMTESIQMPMCPMAQTCKGMTDKPLSGFMIVIPGIFLIVLGLVVLVGRMHCRHRTPDQRRRGGDLAGILQELAT